MSKNIQCLSPNAATAASKPSFSSVGDLVAAGGDRVGARLLEPF